MVARHEHERLAGADDAPDQRRLDRAAAVGQVAGEEHRAARGRALEDREREHVVVQVRGERQPRPVLERGPVGRRGDEPREADQLRVELLVERPRGALGGLHRLQRARDVGTEGVVLRLVDRAARREQDDERDRHEQRGGDGGAARVAELRRRAAPHRERDEHPERAAAQEHEQDEVAQVGRDRVARVLAHRPDVDLPTVRHAPDDVAVDRLEVHAQAGGEADRLEARTPVDERHVDVERALVAGGDGEPDLADRQLPVLPEGDEREVAAGQRRDDDRGERERPAERQERARKSWRAFVVDQKASSCHGISSGSKVRTSVASGVVRGVASVVAAKTIRTTRSSGRE